MGHQTVALPVYVAVIWLINAGISFWNARAVGKVWVESKQVGGMMRFLVWCGAIMAYCGWLYCYAIIEAFIGNWLRPDLVTPQVMQGIFALSYLIIIVPILGTGFAITANSIYVAWQQRDWKSIGVASWNTFAQMQNTYSAMRGIPEAGGILKDLFGGKSSSSSGKGNGAALLVVVIIVAMAAILAFITTAGIIMKYAGTRELPDHPEHGRKAFA